MSEEAAPAAAGKGVSAAAVAFGTMSALPKRKTMNGSTTALQCATPAQASTAAAAPPASTTAVPRRSIPAMPARRTRRLDAQAPPICPSMTAANISP